MQALMRSKLLAGTSISIEICLIKLITSSQKSYKDNRMKEVTKTINALLNSGGGNLQLLYKSTPTRKQVDDCIRIIEQKIGDLIGTVTLISKIEVKALPQKILINVKQAEGPFIFNFNMCFPTKSQVKVIPPSEAVERVRAIINRQCEPAKKPLTLGSYHGDFIKNENANFDEDTNIQWKSLKSEASKRVTLADRITCKSNKLSYYVSAFANLSGGHVYFGINDYGVVEGEEVTEKDQIEVTRKVAKTIEKMIWPKHCGVPQKGTQWDIFFIHVKDGEGRQIASTFVIVVAIARCPGGVFTDIPESYHIKDGRVEQTNVVDWTEYFSATLEEPPEPVPLAMPLSTWSSAKNRKIYQVLTTKLVQFRNDKKTNRFNVLCETAISKFPESCAQLVVTAEKAAIACKNNEFRTARCLLDDFSKILQRSDVKDALFFEVRGLCLRSRNERAEGNYEQSYLIAKGGLQKMQSVPAEFLTVWFYIHTAAVAIILSSKETDLHRYNSLVNEGQTYLKAALRDANTLDQDQFPRSSADLKLKARIYLAMTFLGCSLTGEIVEQRTVTKVDIDNAALELKAVQESKLDGIKPTHFQEIEYLLAQSDLCYRRSTLFSCLAKQTQDLKWAFELCKKAQCLALELDFEEAVHYAGRRLSRLTELLVRNALQSRRKRIFENDLENLINFS